MIRSISSLNFLELGNINQRENKYFVAVVWMNVEFFKLFRQNSIILRIIMIFKNNITPIN